MIKFKAEDYLYPDYDARGQMVIYSDDGRKEYVVELQLIEEEEYYVVVKGAKPVWK